LAWQSKLILLAVAPATAIDVLLKTQWWAGRQLDVAIWAVGASLILGLITWKMRAATPAAAVTGTVITASLMFDTLQYPYEPWNTALVPILAVSLLAFVSTRAGRTKKQRLGTAEKHSGREASQVAANLGFAALIATEFARSTLDQMHWLPRATPDQSALIIAALAAMSEAAADTVSSELGQVFGGRPRMLTTLAPVDPGTDGAITLTGSISGAAAAMVVAAAGTWALHGSKPMFAISAGGATFGLFFDSLLGATLEKAGWLNNDAVNFLSTISAAAFALAAQAFTH
jgi:uncharacterized protein (TIGR00297 family)